MRLILLGDVMLGRLVNDVLKKAPSEYVWGDTLTILKKADARIENLECVISDRGDPWPNKVFTYRTDGKNVKVLKVAEITAVTLANNHSLDYGEKALLDCLKILKKHHIHYAGAGTNLEEATRPVQLRVNNLTISLISCTDNEPDWEARADAPGVFHVPFDNLADPRFKLLISRVAEAKENSDLVIVAPHWGPNWEYDPLPEHIEAARKLVEAGTDIIFGHSPHIFRGIELYQGQPILYSCGDFIDDYAVDEIERNDWSFMFTIDYADGELSRITLMPTVIRDFQARLASREERLEIMDRMQKLCTKLGTKTRITAAGLEIEATHH